MSRTRIAPAAIVMQGLARDPADRFPTALAMAEAIERAMPLVAAREVGEWVKSRASQRLELRAKKVAEVESSSSVLDGMPAAATVAAALGTPQELSAITDRSQVGSVVDRRSLAPKPGALRFIALAAVAVAIAGAAVIYFGRQRAVEHPSVPAAAVSTSEPQESASTLVTKAPAPPSSASVATPTESVAPPVASSAVTKAPVVKHAAPRPTTKTGKKPSIYSRY